MQEKKSQEMVSMIKQLESSLEISQTPNETSGDICCADVTDDVHNNLHRYICTNILTR